MNLKNKLASMRRKIKDKVEKTNAKPHLLIAGGDLKFIEPSIPYLNKYYEIKIDRIKGRKITEESKELLKWADIVFCEWLESYAAWYSNNIQSNQKLFIRAHKYEITKKNKFKADINFDNVDGLITINYFLLELFSNVYSVPREKMFFLNNFIETSIYSGQKKEDYKHNIALVGYSPNYKGYKRALEVLYHLKQKDNKFKLYLMGKDYTEMHWGKHQNQIDYFNDCDSFIEEHDLSDSIIRQGWIEREEMFSNIGYVLSVSDVEGSHLSPSEGILDRSISVLINWPGSKYIYPNELIFNDVDGISEFILDSYNDNYEILAEKYCKLFKKEFGEELFVEGLHEIFKTNRNNPKYPYDKLISFEDIKNNYLTPDNTIDETKLLKNFKNSHIINDETEIEEILSKNPKNKVTLFLSKNIEINKIKNIYQRYSSDECLIYSIYFLENLDEANRFIELCNEIHTADIVLR